jgi:hypothetical protein
VPIAIGSDMGLQWKSFCFLQKIGAKSPVPLPAEIAQVPIKLKKTQHPDMKKNYKGDITYII